MLIRYLLLLGLLKKSQQAGASVPHFSQPILRNYRILPHDMGFRDHIPNYRYLSFIELNIEQWFREQSSIADAKWIIAAQQMTYLKQGKLWNKVLLSSQLLGWDSKYFYFRHEFTVKGQLIAIALTKFVIMADGQVIATDKIVDKPQQMHPVVTTWQANQNAIKQLDKIDKNVDTAR